MTSADSSGFFRYFASDPPVEEPDEEPNEEPNEEPDDPTPLPGEDKENGWSTVVSKKDIRKPPLNRNKDAQRLNDRSNGTNSLAHRTTGDGEQNSVFLTYSLASESLLTVILGSCW